MSSVDGMFPFHRVWNEDMSRYACEGSVVLPVTLHHNRNHSHPLIILDTYPSGNYPTPYGNFKSINTTAWHLHFFRPPLHHTLFYRETFSCRPDLDASSALFFYSSGHRGRFALDRRWCRAIAPHSLILPKRPELIPFESVIESNRQLRDRENRFDFLMHPRDDELYSAPRNAISESVVLLIAMVIAPHHQYPPVLPYSVLASPGATRGVTIGRKG